MKKFATLAIPFLAAVSSPAMAQDATGGFRLEALVGYDIIRAEFEEGEGREAERGVLGGIGLGFDFPLGTSLMAGIDAEGTFTTTDVDIEDVGEVKAREDLYVGGRITGALSERVSIYGKAGYTNLRVKLNVEDEEEEDEDSEFEASGRLNGVRGAVGVQIRGEDRDYYGFEYRYSNYEAGVDRHQAMLVFGVRF